MERDRPQHERSAVCVIAQQYSPARFILLQYNFRKEKCSPRFTNAIISIYFLLFKIYFKLRKSEVLVGKPEGKRPLGRPRRRWVDNIRMDLQEVGCGYMDWIGLAQDRDRWRTLVRAVMNLRAP